MENNGSQLPKEMMEALLQGYDIRITKEVKDGIVMAKVIYEKYSGANRYVMGRAEELLKKGKH